MKNSFFESSYFWFPLGFLTCLLILTPHVFRNWFLSLAHFCIFIYLRHELRKVTDNITKKKSINHQNSILLCYTRKTFLHSMKALKILETFPSKGCVCQNNSHKSSSLVTGFTVHNGLNTCFPFSWKIMWYFNSIYLFSILGGVWCICVKKKEINKIYNK
jgi:hypothetical protein